MSKRGANFHSVWMSIESALDRVQGLQSSRGADARRATLHQGNMRAGADTKLRCRKCGPTPVRSYIPISMDV
jgi:hypothetical protein